MSLLDDVKTDLAERAYAMANSPQALIRSLRADILVNNIKRTHQSDTLVQALKESIAKEPKTLKDLVEPYVLLVAISLGDSIGPLKEVAGWEAPHCRWYGEIANALMRTYQPTLSTIIQIPGQVRLKPPTTPQREVPTFRNFFDIHAK